jgi:hypothetical protein
VSVWKRWIGGREGGRRYVQMTIRTCVKYVPVTKFYSKPYISVVLCAVCVCNCVLSYGIYHILTVERHSAEDSMTGLLHTDR